MSDAWYDFLGTEARERNRTDVLIANDRRYDALMETLALAVPLRMLDLYYRTPEQRCVIAKRCAQEVASHGDTLMFSGKKGAAAKVFNALAEGLAAAAYQPGGVTFAGRHWCTDHRECERAAAAAVLPDAACDCEPVAQVPAPRTVDTIQPSGQWEGAL